MNSPTSFDDCFDALINHEGGYVNHPSDPGGETKFGITKRSYPDLNIADLTLAQAKAIYRRDVWDRMALDQTNELLRFQLFDAAVNSGVGNAVRWLQAAAEVAPDGNYGPQTRAAVGRMDARTLLARFNGHRLAFMTSLAVWPTFGKGWARRIAENLKGCA